MRHAGLLLALLAAAIQLPACAATTGTPGVIQGQSGPITWDIIDMQQVLEENGTRMRWNFVFVFKNTGGGPFDFERVEIASRAGGPVDDLYGGMNTVPYAQHLEPDGELRAQRSEALSCPQCAAGHLPRFFGNGIIIYYTFFGRGGAGGAVRVPIAVRLNSSVGERK